MSKSLNDGSSAERQVVQEMTLSIGIPAYNQGAFIGETIESALNQTVKPLEIVVSDNHSSDDTAKILEEFGDRIKVVRPPEFIPMTANWNYVVSQSSGTWFSVLSSDDIALPNFVETLTRGMEESDRTILVWGDYGRIDGSGRYLRTKRFHRARRVTSPPQTLLEQLDGPKIGLLSFAARKDEWEKVGGFPESCYIYGDWGLYLKLAALGDFAYENEPIALYRVEYRESEQNKKRVPLAAKDSITLFTKIIPEIAREMPGVDDATVRKFSQMWCRDRIAFASRELGSNERDEVAEILSDWALDCGWGDELESFRRGAKVYRKPYGLLRRTASQLSEAVRDFGRILRGIRDRRPWRDRYPQ